MEITSVHNDKVKFWEKLKNKKYRDSERLFLIEDNHLIDEALKLNLVKEIITMDDKEYNVPTYHVNDKIMKCLSEQTSGSSLIAVCSFLEEKELEGNIIVLDRVQDPGNLGTILRSALAFNFNNIILSNDSVDLYNSKVIRASEGMIFHLNIIRTDIRKFLNNLDSSYLKISTNVKDGKDIKELKFEKCALVLGNEGSGVSNDVASLCDEVVNIKMSDKVESLNVGVSASILMFEVYHG